MTIKIRCTLIVLPCLLAMALPGCDDDSANIGQLEAIWGKSGVSEGRFQKPRAIAIGQHDEVYIVDKMARIQVFDPSGRFLRAWRTPEFKNGKPTGLAVGIDGNVLVADTHYFRVLIYSPRGELLKTIDGTKASALGQFGQVTDVVQDSRGNYYIGEKGECDRILKFSPEGRYVLQWGSHGSEPGQLMLPQSLAVDEQDHVWVTDSCNHRIQVFDPDGKLLAVWGSEGRAPGQLYYPYDLVLAPENTVYLCEYGNNRVQKFTRDGRSLGCWGRAGRGEGELSNPWGLVRDSQGRILVLDTNNHRVQRVRM